MLKTLLLFYSLIIIQNVQTQLIQNGCNCKKRSNLAVSQVLSNNYLNPRSVHNAQSIDLPSNVRIYSQNGQLTSSAILNGHNLNNVVTTGNDFLFTSNLAPNKCTKTANNILRTYSNLPSQLANNALFNELVSQAITASTCNVPTIKSTVNNKLLNNGVQYSVGIQIDKKNLLNKIISNNGAIKGNMEILKMLQGDTVPVVNDIHYDTNDYNNIKMVNEPINIDNQYNNFNMQSDNFLLDFRGMPVGMPGNNEIHYIENVALRSDTPIANNIVYNLEQTTDKMSDTSNNIQFANQIYVQNDIDLQQGIPITHGIQVTNDQLNINFPSSNAMIYDNNALLNNIAQPNGNPVLNNMMITNTMPVANNQFDNTVNTGNLFNPNLNIPNNILLNTNALISNNQIPMNNINYGMQVPNLELNMPNTGTQYNEDITSLNGLSLNNFVNANTADLSSLNGMSQTNQIYNSPLNGDLHGEQSWFNLPVTLAQLEESLGNIHLSMPTKLADWNTLNLGQYGCLPIINGLPVATITETVTVLNPNI